jgi:hypothetical protein
MQVTAFGEFLSKPVEVWIVSPYIDAIKRRLVYGKHETAKGIFWINRAESPFMHSIRTSGKKPNMNNVISAQNSFNSATEAQDYVVLRAAKRVLELKAELEKARARHSRLLKKFARA